MASANIEPGRELKLMLDQAEMTVEMWRALNSAVGQLNDAEQVIMEGEQENIALREELARQHGQIEHQAQVHRENRAATQAHVHNLTSERDALVQALAEANQQIEQLKAAAADLEKAAIAILVESNDETVEEAGDVEA